ncbi:MAG: hypothetical protein GQF41_0877 [Candidatus Rifleibacterium amylolyticum]|nr:MAG: hypothetical protein GQF41_0877 [Candidatus Rifleibacterium amylolyticum]
MNVYCLQHKAKPVRLPISFGAQFASAVIAVISSSSEAIAVNLVLC